MRRPSPLSPKTAMTNNKTLHLSRDPAAKRKYFNWKRTRMRKHKIMFASAVIEACTRHPQLLLQIEDLAIPNMHDSIARQVLEHQLRRSCLLSGRWHEAPYDYKEPYFELRDSLE